MKTTWKILLAAAALPLACGAAGNQSRAILDKAQSTSPQGGVATTVLNNGDINAVVSDAGHDTYVSIKQIGGSAAVVTASDGISQTSTVVDLDAAIDWRRSHQSQAYSLDRMKLLVNSKRAISFDGTATHGATPVACVPTLQTQLAAADSAASACADRGGLVCALALADYAEAKSSYKSCIKGKQTGSD